MTWYSLLKVVHVLSAIAWIGGGAAFSMVIARLVQAGDRAALTALLPQASRYMQRVAGPASGVVLLTGIPMVILGKIGFGTLWVSLGFAGIIVHGVFGGLVMRKRTEGVLQAVSGTTGDADVAQTGARLRIASVIYLLIMAAVVAVMVLKPTL